MGTRFYGPATVPHSHKLKARQIATYAGDALFGAGVFRGCPRKAKKYPDMTKPEKAQCNKAIRVIATMTAIALCESRGDILATNHNCPNGTCYGLWQQNEGQGQQLYHASTAAAHMASTYAQSGYQYWGCGPAHGGGYVPYMPAAMIAARGYMKDRGPGGGIAGAAGDVAGAITSPIAAIAGIVGALFRGSTWIRVGEVVSGIGLVFVGITFAARDLGLGPVERFGRRNLKRFGAVTRAPVAIVTSPRRVFGAGKQYRRTVRERQSKGEGTITQRARRRNEEEYRERRALERQTKSSGRRARGKGELQGVENK